VTPLVASGTIKAKPASWKDLFVETILSAPGS